MTAHVNDEKAWLEKYYQIGNRLTFLMMLREQRYNVKLVLLNMVKDSTHISTSLEDWEKHYKEVFQLLLGSSKCPENVVIVNFDVG